MAVQPQDSQSWSGKGTKDAMARTYAAVVAAIEASEALKTRNIKTFLQGSYANATNIRGDSDVDIVVMMKGSWHADKSLLSDVEKVAYDRDHSNSLYTAAHLRQDVIKTLQNHFGAERVEPRKKSIRIHKSNGYVDADVVPALQHRVYLSYDSTTRGRFVEGTKLHPKEGPSIVNFPKVHRINGREKNLATGKNFKPAVRQMKQLKRRAVNSGRVNPKSAPGYLLECMVFNAPDGIFVEDHHSRLLGVLQWLLKADFSNFKSVDKIHELFRTDPGNYSDADAKLLAVSLAQEMVE